MIEFTNSNDVDKFIDTRHSDMLNRYVYKGRTESMKPVYENGYTGRAFWFIGEFAAWINGDLADLDDNRSTTGSMHSTPNSQCPNTVSEWKEHNNGAWIVNNDVIVNCVIGFYEQLVKHSDI